MNCKVSIKRKLFIVVFLPIFITMWMVGWILTMLPVKKEEKGMKLNWWQKIWLKIRGRVFYGWEFQKGWSKAHKTYVCNCPAHGLYSGHLYGAYDDKTPDCPQCIKDFAAKVSLLNQKV